MPARRRSPPLWAIALTGALVAAGVGRERSPDANDPNARSHGRGRDARAPSEIPAPGWKDVLWRTFGEVSEDRIMLISAGVTFYAVLAVFPATAALVSIYGLFTDATSLEGHLSGMASVLPGGAIEVIGDQMRRVAAQGASTLGFTFLFGLAVSLWSANAGMKSLFDALNIIYEEQEKRSFLKLNVISLAFTLGAIVFLLLALTAIAVLPTMLAFIGLERQSETLVTIGRWPLLLLTVVFAFSLLYRYGPSREKAQWRWLTWGGALAAFSWLVASMLFSWYAANFGSYNETYGALGAAIGFMIWMWISAMVILVGAELNAEMEHQTAQDTTTGHPKPIGTRGARMADTVGAAQER
jgi:membrane protein